MSGWLIFAHLWPVSGPKALVILTGAVAFSLSFMLDGVIYGFNDAVAKLSDSNVAVSNRSHSADGLPLAYRTRIEAVEGVADVWPVNGFSASHFFQTGEIGAGQRHRARRAI